MDDRTVDLGIDGLGPARLIGRGGFGAVYLARQESMGRDVAVKVLPAEALESGAWEQFERERRTMAAVGSRDGIVMAFDSGTTGDGRPYLIMEYMDGGSIGELLRQQGPMPIERAVEIASRIGRAVDAVHREGILHRDIKPDNIMLSREGEARLTDFGIAKIVSTTATRTAHLAVSVQYAPPEILNGEPATQASDVFALGATTYAMLAGDSPFRRSPADTLPVIIQRALAVDVPDLRTQGVPREVARVVEMALAATPEDRFDTAREFADALEGALARRSRRDGTGTMSYLFTDIEGSTGLWEENREAMDDALAHHDELLAVTVAEHRGDVVKTTGDGLLAAFNEPLEAVTTAIEAQERLAAVDWSPLPPLRVRMAVHSGTAYPRDGDYYGPTVNRAARIMELAHGGQVLVSAATHELVVDYLADEVTSVDMGVHELRSLSRPEHIFEIRHPAALPPKGVRVPAHAQATLPASITSFVGRSEELDALTQLLMTSRIVTLVGTGGAGKTRLAIEAAAHVSNAFPDGSYFVDLAPILDEELVLKEVAAALGVGERPAAKLLDGVIQTIRPKAMLLIVDNCEHLPDAVGPLVTTLLDSCPHLTVLATSLGPLHVAGEVPYRLPSLAVPEPGATPTTDELMAVEAVQLFVDRAQLVDRGFRLTAQNAEDVAGLVRRLDGLPLAIELAASRIDSLAPAGILAQLTGDGGLDATIEWSRNLLTDAERIVFDRLSVFAGDFTLEAAEAVTGYEPVAPEDIFDLVTALVTKSMLIRASDADESRFHVLNTLRAYGRRALERTGAGEAVAERHARYYVQLVDRLGPEVMGPGSDAVRNQIEREYHDLRAVMTWCLDRSEHAWAMRLVDGLTWFWYWRGYHLEANRWIERLLREAPDDDSPIRAKVLYAAGLIADVSGELDRSRQSLEAGLEMSRRLEAMPLIARFLTAMGVIRRDHGVLREAEDFLDEAVATARRLAMPEAVALASRFMGDVAFMVGNVTKAEAALAEAMETFDRLDRKGDLGWAHHVLASIHLAYGRYEAAAEELATARRLHDADSYRRGQAWIGLNETYLALAQGELDAAEEALQQAVATFQAIGDTRGTVYASLATAALDRTRDDYEAAEAHAADAEQCAESIGETRGLALAVLERARLAAARDDDDTALAQSADAVRRLVDLGDRWNLGAAAELWARSAHTEGAGEAAAQVRGYVERLRDELAVTAPVAPPWPEVHDGVAIEKGRQMTDGELVSLVTGGT